MQNLIIHGFENYIWLGIGALFLMGMFLSLIFKSQKNNFTDDSLLTQVYGQNSYWYYVYIVLLFMMSSIFFMILAGPYNDKEIETIKKNGIDIEVVFDLSQSMLAGDLQPTRLDVSKRVLSDFITGIQSDRTGLILFAGKAFQSIPLSYDYDFLGNFIEKITIDTIDVENPDLQGTAIGDALVLASDVLTHGENDREKVIILITDGTANRGVDPEVALKLLKEKNIKTYTIGVGKEGITVIDVSVGPGFTQRVEIPGVDEKSLQNIARETGGRYFRADSQGAFQEILDTISTLEKSELEIEQIQFHSPRTEILLYLLILCFGFLGYIVFIKKIQL